MKKIIIALCVCILFGATAAWANNSPRLQMLLNEKQRAFADENNLERILANTTKSIAQLEGAIGERTRADVEIKKLLDEKLSLQSQVSELKAEIESLKVKSKELVKTAVKAIEAAPDDNI